MTATGNEAVKLSQLQTLYNKITNDFPNWDDAITQLQDNVETLETENTSLATNLNDVIDTLTTMRNDFYFSAGETFKYNTYCYMPVVKVTPQYNNSALIISIMVLLPMPKNIPDNLTPTINASALSDDSFLIVNNATGNASSYISGSTIASSVTLTKYSSNLVMALILLNSGSGVTFTTSEPLDGKIQAYFQEVSFIFNESS